MSGGACACVATTSRLPPAASRLTLHASRSCFTPWLYPVPPQAAVADHARRVSACERMRLLYRSCPIHDPTQHGIFALESSRALTFVVMRGRVACNRNSIASSESCLGLRCSGDSGPRLYLSDVPFPRPTARGGTAASPSPLHVHIPPAPDGK